MERFIARLAAACAAVFVAGTSIAPLAAHNAPDHAAVSMPARAADTPPAGAVSGQGKMRFRVLMTSEGLPEDARKVLVNAHGGFAVDRRPDRGEAYFALPGAGIMRISADLKNIRMMPTPDNMKKVNLHNTTIWYSGEGAPYLVFPANDAGKVFTTTLDGTLVNTLDAPTGNEEFSLREVGDYFRGGGNFAPTDVEELDGLYYVTTGYSNLDYVLTARILSADPLRAVWNDLVFGGKGKGLGQFETGHGITVPPGKKRLDVSDRPNSRIERFSRYGQYLSMVRLPAGSLPCDVSYLDQYAVVAALDGPDTSKGAPIYILENDQLISTIMPKEELGLQNFKHNHNAVLTKIGSRYYIIVQAWNPGDFAILEQALE
ncbi:MAG: hypothetical protein ACE145_21010 [Terriglobia bacterium]